MPSPVLIGGCLLFAVGVFALYEWSLRWWTARIVKRVQDRIDHPEKYASETPARRDPESRFVVRMTETEVVCERPDGKTERVAWSDLQSVEVITTDDGPFAPDVYWVLIGSSGGCAVPQGATGDRELLEKLQALPDFDNENFIRAMGSTDHARFPCWRKSDDSLADCPAPRASS